MKIAQDRIALTQQLHALCVDYWHDVDTNWGRNAPDYYTRLYAPDYDGRETETCYDSWRDAGLTEDDVRLSHATYAGEVSLVDRWVGRLVEKLDVLGISDETVVFFLSDHGYYFGEHGYLGKSVWDEALGTQSWSPLYREIVDVPLLVQMPGVRPRRTPALSTLVGALLLLPGGLGGTEGSMVAMLGADGISRPQAVAATFLTRIATLWFAVGLGAVAFASLRFVRSRPRAPEGPES